MYSSVLVVLTLITVSNNYAFVGIKRCNLVMFGCATPIGKPLRGLQPNQHGVSVSCGCSGKDAKSLLLRTNSSRRGLEAISIQIRWRRSFKPCVHWPSWLVSPSVFPYFSTSQWWGDTKNKDRSRYIPNFFSRWLWFFSQFWHDFGPYLSEHLKNEKVLTFLL